MSNRREKHIIDLIEGHLAGEFSADDLRIIKAHTDSCEDCRIAFFAAQVSETLLRERASQSVEPSPFFQTRVLALMREREVGNEGWGLRRLWRAAGALAASMAATVALLIALTFVIPGTKESTTAVNSYSTEAVLLNVTPDDLESDGQVLRTLYGAEEEVAR